jgi:hypothetical protein
MTAEVNALSLKANERDSHFTVPLAFQRTNEQTQIFTASSALSRPLEAGFGIY